MVGAVNLLQSFTTKDGPEFSHGLPALAAINSISSRSPKTYFWA